MSPCSGNEAQGGIDKGICFCQSKYSGEDCSALQLDETHPLCDGEDQTYSICRYLREGMVELYRIRNVNELALILLIPCHK